MKKKKLLVLLPAMLLMLGSCDGADSSSSVVPPDPSSDTSSVTPPSSSSSSEEVKTGKVSIISAQHVTVTADKTEAKVGDIVTFTVKVDDTYELSYFKVNGKDVEVKDGKATAAMVEGGLSVTFSAVSIKYDVTITKTDNVTVTADVEKTIIGAVVTFTITPDDGYTLVTFKVNDNTVDVKDGKATYNMVKGGLTAVASVEKIKYAVSIDKNIVNGTVTADVEKASEGDDVTFTITPDDDFELDTFKVNNETVAVENGKATVKMVKEGLNATATFKGIKHSVTIPTNIVNGTVTADKTEATTGENVTFTVTPADTYDIGSFKVNGVETTVKDDGTATVPMVKDGLTVTVEFVEHYDEVNAIDDTFVAKVEAADVARYKLTDDITASSLPLAKQETVVDLNGKTLSVSEKSVLVASEGQKITVKNGKIKMIWEPDEYSANYFNVANAHSFTLSDVELSDTKQPKGNQASATIHASNATYLTVSDCVINTKTTFGISTNNLEGKSKGEFKVIDSTITVATADNDNCAMIVNTNYDTEVTIENSKLTADRQAIIARTGSWNITGSELNMTGKWAADSNNATKDANREANTWEAGNEVISAALVVGDTSTGAYNCDASVKLDGVTISSIGKNAIVGRTDGTYKTSIEMDALTYLNNYQSIDVADGVTVTKNNVIEKTVAEMNELKTTDSKNLYMVTGNVKSTWSTGGNLVDESGKTLTMYGIYTPDSANHYSESDGNFTFNADSAQRIDASYVGKEITVIGTFTLYNNKTPEIVNGIAFIEDVAVESLDLEYKSDEGTVTLSGDITNTKVGDTVTVIVTPKDGYKIDAVKLTKQGTTTDITSDLSFVAGRTNKIVVTFINTNLPDEDTYTMSFNKTNNSKGVSDYESTWQNSSMGKKFEIVNFNNNNNGWDLIKCGKKGAATVASISSIDLFKNALSKVSIEFGTVKSGTYNSVKLYVASDAKFDNVITTLNVTPEDSKTVDIAIDKPTANCYYKLVFDMKNTTTKNGHIEVKTVIFAK